MKFWQLVSIFRDDIPSLENALKEPKWSKYFDWFKDFDPLVRSQDREVLDAIVPKELVEPLLEASELKFCIRNRSLILWSDEIECENPLSALEVYRRFGADAMEDVLEFGSKEVSL